MNQVNFMDSCFDTHDMYKSINTIIDWCEVDQPAKTVITLNAGLLMAMKNDSALQQACANGALTLADGKPIVLASKLLGNAIPHRVAGVDLMANTLEAGSAAGISVYFLGAKQEIIDKLTNLCADRYSGLKIAGSRNGYFSESEHPQIIEDIAQSQADILYIGMPSPFKEIWGERYRDQLGVKVIFGVGGSFDVLAGSVTRAPVWLQELCLEWAWRLAMEPRKMWKRYLITNTQFIAQLAGLLTRRYITQRHTSSDIKVGSN
ncbi:MAG TPA: glycosyltransferase [Gammaproteobacteria bacterium]|jgi:N-acetylglucosaminyldiphosphoundecaprenol N-acetyl-beta-D-mannosaminyltransferase|nr:glycosyltransferase [Gammaproteobacteria bacterium]